MPSEAALKNSQSGLRRVQYHCEFDLFLRQDLLASILIDKVLHRLQNLGHWETGEKAYEILILLMKENILVSFLKISGSA